MADSPLTTITTLFYESKNNFILTSKVLLSSTPPLSHRNVKLALYVDTVLVLEHLQEFRMAVYMWLLNLNFRN